MSPARALAVPLWAAHNEGSSTPRRAVFREASENMDKLHLLRLIILVVAVCPLVYYALAIYCAWEHFRKVHTQPAPDRSFAPPVSILKPVRGVDAEAYENFASFCNLDYPDYEIVFATGSEDDPIVPVIRRLQMDFPQCEIRLLTSMPHAGTNRKVNKLCALARQAKYDVLAISDSDVRVEKDYLREAVAPLADPSTGLVTTLFRGKTGKGIFSQLNGLSVPADSAASALVALKMEGRLNFAFGWTMATTKQHLAEIGGFEAIANYHSDDFELGNRIAGQGHEVVFMRKPVWMVFPSETLSQFLQHEFRWAIGLRNVRPAGYLGLMLTFGLLWSVLAAIVEPSVAIGVTYLGAYLILRYAMAWTVGVWGIGDPITRKSLWMVPVRDALNIGVWFAGFFSDTVSWRGTKFTVRDGLLMPVAEPSIEIPAHTTVVSAPNPSR
jgi:ceramide glucosyltransferase